MLLEKEWKQAEEEKKANEDRKLILLKEVSVSDTEEAEEVVYDQEVN